MTKTQYRRSLLAPKVLLHKDEGFLQPTPEQVKRLFSHAGWTQAEAFRKLGVDVSTIRRWHTQKKQGDIFLFRMQRGGWL